ncbi:Arylesterase [Pseudocercospora fuligena]|uniref:Arylesterase n=1 Tax=Pseudocercospora fuligena TaxID=685502 RepID=A0A8H6RDZ0_9PEZI|nr:Arylesterase [Pseudocercospora fuligena]
MADATLIERHSIPAHLLPGLDPEWVKLWNDHGRQHVRADEVTLEEYRKDPAAHTFSHASWTGPAVHHEEEMKIPVTNPDGEVEIRIYSPHGSGPFGVHFNMHGGGWTLGGLETEAGYCRSVCNKAGVKVVDIDYRLAPEYIFPIAFYDCWTVIKWVIANADKINIKSESVSVGGLSAGGTMSAVLSHFAKDEGIMLKLALLVVPSVDLRWSIAEEPTKSEVAAKYPSVALSESFPWGPRSRVDWFMSYWIPPGIRKEAATDWRASPILAPNLKGLPRTHIVIAEYDWERDESSEYAEMLAKAGVEVTKKLYLGVPHAFGHCNHPEKGLAQSRLYLEETASLIKEVHM